MIFGTVEAWGEGEEIYGGTSCSHAIKKYSETELFDFIMNAVDAGFDQFDTSPLYHNERELGEIFHKLDPVNPEDGYRRTNYRIISKLPPDKYGYENTIKAYLDSAQHLNISDYLIHWPTFPLKELESTWRAFEWLKKNYHINIGVCNFDIPHLKKLFDIADSEPCVNQIECHLYLQNLELLDFCHANGLEVQSYGSLFRGKGEHSIEYMIGWLLSQDVNPIVSSSRYQRLVSLKECDKDYEPEIIDHGKLGFDFKKTETFFESYQYDNDPSEFNKNTRLLMDPNLISAW